ncbi:MAG: hypothetical protein A2156_13950 [Deltaproteobacteria bacterium RBG_16_48_10]|nr:MAG: hypothetical protein A2156_13950 [Deltaproteobacteria bacterium RBG_16_48_10]
MDIGISLLFYDGFLELGIYFVANLILLYTYSEAVIPAKAGIHWRETGFRVKPGMTNRRKKLMNHYTGLIKM